MFKVVLVLKQFSVRLKECELDIILRKNKENLVLCSKLSLYNGYCLINLVKEIYVDIDYPKIVLLFYLIQGCQKRYGGEIALNVFQWEENVIHSTEAKITNSPDRSSCIKYEFYYFRDEKLIDNRALLQERLKQQYNLIQNSNKELCKEKLKLQEEVFSWHKKNQLLESDRQDMIIKMSEREYFHNSQKGNCLSSINQYSEQYSKEKEKKEGLIRLVDEHQLGQSEQNQMEG